MKALCPLCGLESDEFDPRYVREWPEHCGERMQELPAEQALASMRRAAKPWRVNVTARNDADADRAQLILAWLDARIAELWEQYFGKAP